MSRPAESTSTNTMVGVERQSACLARSTCWWRPLMPIALWGVVTVGVAAACGGKPKVRSPRPITAEAYRQRLALGAQTQPLADAAAERARLLRLIDFHRKARQRPETLRAIRGYLGGCRIDRLLAEIDGRAPDAVAAAERTVQAARKLAIEAGAELHAPMLVLDAIGEPPKPGDPYAAEYLAAYRVLEYRPNERGFRAAVRLAAGDPEALLDVYRIAARDPEPAPDRQTLLAGGARATELLMHRWEDESAEGDERALVRAAKDVLTVDPMQIRPRLALLYYEDVARKLIEPRPRIIAAIIARHEDGTGFVRLEGAVAEKPEAVSLALGLVFRYYTAELTGDAHVALAKIEGLGKLTAAQRKVAAELRAMLDLAAGDVARYRAWARASHGDRSTFLADLEMQSTSGTAPDVWSDLAVEARRRSLRLDLPSRGTWSRDRSVASDASAPIDLRKLALERLWRSDPTSALGVESCLARSLPPKECDALLDTLDELEQGEDLTDEPLELLRRAAPILDRQPDLLWGILSAGPKQLAAVLPWLKEHELSYLGATEPYASVRVRAHVAAGDVDGAAAFLDSHGAMLFAEERLQLRLAMGDLRHKRATLEQVLEYLDWGSALPPPIRLQERRHWDWIDEKTYAGDLGAYHCGKSHWDEGNPEAVLEHLVPLMDRIDDGDRGVLALYVLLAADAVDDAALRNRAMGILRAQPEARLMARYAAAELDRHHGSSTRARARIAEVWALHPESTVLQTAYIETLTQIEPGADALPLVRQALSVSGQRLSYELRWLREAIEVGQLSRGDAIARALDAQRDPAAAVALGAAGRTISTLFNAAKRQYHNRLLEAPNGAKARELAAEAAAYLDGSAEADDVVVARAWLHFLAGDGASARRIALTPVGEDSDGPLPEDAPLVLLTRERTAGAIDDDTAWALWKHFNDKPDKPLDLAQRLLDTSKDANGGLTVACRLLVDADLIQEAMVPCWNAWHAGGNTANLAVAVSFLLVNVEDQAAAMGIDVGEFFAEVARRVSTEDGAWLRNLAYWHRKHGRFAEAAEAARRAWLGNEVWTRYPDKAEFREARYRGTLIRYQIARSQTAGPAGRVLRLMYGALAGGHLEAARFYGRVHKAHARSEEHDPDPELTTLMHGALELASADVASGALDDDAVADWFAVIGGSGDPKKFAERHPASLLGSILLLEDITISLQERLRVVDELLARAPTNVLVAADAVPLLLVAGNRDRAEKLLVAARAAHPDNESLRRLKVRKEPKAAESAWLRNPSTFRKRLAKVTSKELRALHPVYKSDPDAASAAFFPAGYRDHATMATGAVSDENTWTAIATFPRAAMCEGLGCLAGLMEPLVKVGFKEVWRAEVSTPAGRGASLLAENNGNVVLFTIIPIGGRLCALYFSTSVEAAARHLADYRLLEDTFRPLDRWLSADRGHALRATNAYLLSDAQRYALETALRSNRDRAGCPLTKSLRSLSSDLARAQALLEAMIVAHDETERARLLGCSAPDAPAAAHLGLVTLLSPDPKAFRYGSKVAARFPDETQADASAALLAGDATAVSAEKRQNLGGELPDFGVLQVLAALPEAHRKRLAGDLVRSKSERDRSLALAAGGLVDDAVDPDLLRIAVRNSPPSTAALAAMSMFEREPQPADLMAARKRLDGIKGPLDAAKRTLLAALASGLADQLDPRDRGRLDRAVRLAGKPLDPANQGVADSLVTHLTWKRRTYSLGLSMKGRDPNDPPADLDSDGSYAWNLVIARSKKSATLSPIPTAQLRTLPLPALLDGPSWSYVRIAQPGLFAATIRGMLRRLRGPSKIDTSMLQRLARSLMEDTAIGLFGEDGGLDLSRPIECASPGAAEAGHVCAAFVSDADRARSHLIRRKSGGSSGLKSPLELAFGGVYAPVGIVLAPLLVHYVLATGPGDQEFRDVAKERVRSTVRVGGRELERYSVVVVDDAGGTSLESDYYLFVGDRVFLFSDPDLAERFLTDRPAAGSAFAANASYREVAKSWTDGAALQAFVLAGSTEMSSEDAALEFAADRTGFSVRIPLGKPGELADAARTASWLPEGAVSRLTIGVSALTMAGSAATGDALGDLPTISTVDVGTTPPFWLFGHAQVASLGWFAPSGAKLWERWVAVLDHSRAVARSLRKHRFPAPRRDAIRKRKGLHYTVHDGMLIVGSRRDLVAETLARARSAAAPESPILLRGDLRVDEFAAALRKLASGMQAGSPMRQVASVFAMFAGGLKRAEFDAKLDTGTGRVVLRARVEPNLTDEEFDPDVVDQWLASPRLRNSATLPRSLSPRDLEKPVVLELKVEDAKTVAANVFAGAPRISAKVLDASRLRLTLRPGPKPTDRIARVRLDKKARSAALRRTAGFAVSHPKVKAVLAKLDLDKAPPAVAAERIVGWVHEHITYEITPSQPDAVAILERGRGDCTELSLLSVTLLRTAGIPAEVRTGMAIVGDQMVAHAWIAYYDGKGWREADPTAGENWVGAGHIEASLMDMLSLISMGGLEILSVETP